MVAELRAMKLKEAAKKVEDGIEETLTYCDFPSEHWTRIRTNNVIERLNREIRRRTRVVGTFPDGNSALMLVCARLRHVTGRFFALQLRDETTVRRDLWDKCGEDTLRRLLCERDRRRAACSAVIGGMQDDASGPGRWRH